MFLQSRSIVKATAILFPLLGVTWVFGLIPVSSETIIFSYVFVLLNSLQVMDRLLTSTSILANILCHLTDIIFK